MTSLPGHKSCRWNALNGLAIRLAHAIRTNGKRIFRSECGAEAQIDNRSAGLAVRWLAAEPGGRDRSPRRMCQPAEAGVVWLVALPAGFLACWGGAVIL